MNKKQLSKNLIFSLLSIVMSIIQSIWFIPFIIQKIGAEAYGYIAVIMVIINFSTIISIAITSMSSRFITIEMKKNNVLEANYYFNSVLASVIAISILLLLSFMIVIYNITFFIDVSPIYVEEVQKLFLISGLSLILSILSTPFLSSLYYNNKIYIMYLFTTLNYVFKIILPVLLLHFEKIPLWGMSLGGLIIDVLAFVYYFSSYKKHLPNVKVNLKYTRVFNIVKILQSGIWISITKAGSVMLTSIGTYLSNILVGVILSGIYATILQLQTLISIMVTAIVSTFIPNMYHFYASNDIEKLIKYAKTCIRFLSIPLGIISGGIIIYGANFMTLWLGESYYSFSTLIFLTIISLPFSLPAEILNQLNITINRVKTPAVITLVFGLGNVILVWLLTYIFNLGIYGIAGSQLITTIIRGFVFFPVYTATQLKIPAKSFMKEILLCPAVMLITIITSVCVNSFINSGTWEGLIVNAIMVSIVTCLVLYVSYIVIKNMLINKYQY